VSEEPNQCGSGSRSDLSIKKVEFLKEKCNSCRKWVIKHNYDGCLKAFLKSSGIQVYWLVLVSFLAFGIRIRIQKSQIHADPEPHHCLSTLCFFSGTEAGVGGSGSTSLFFYIVFLFSGPEAGGSGSATLFFLHSFFFIQGLKQVDPDSHHCFSTLFFFIQGLKQVDPDPYHCFFYIIFFHSGADAGGSGSTSLFFYIVFFHSGAEAGGSGSTSLFFYIFCFVFRA
jgi:hypothetical protein